MDGFRGGFVAVLFATCRAAQNARAGPLARRDDARFHLWTTACRAATVEPSARSTNAVLVYMHGGGWCGE